MQLRSGKVIPGYTKPNIQDQTDKLSPIVDRTLKYYDVVRQRENAELEKAVDKALQVLVSYVVTFDEVKHWVGVDHVMEKIRLTGMMFAYANSLSIHTIMHPRLGKLRCTLLDLCMRFSKQAKEQIDIRIKAGMETMPERNPKRYYTTHFEDMQGQLDKFTKTYANRL